MKTLLKLNKKGLLKNMKNCILKLSDKQLLELKEKVPVSNCFFVEIDGEQVNSKEMFFEIMSDKFKLPSAGSGWDSFIDWMNDLSWISEECICLVINKYSEFLKDDLVTKVIFEEVFQEDILPFWDKEVLKTVVDGKIRPFNLYLVS